MNKNIAIISSFNFHLECIGFLCELLRDYKITIYCKSDNYGYCIFFSELFKNISIVICNILPDYILTKYDLVIKLTSNDMWIDNERIISLIHLNNKQCKSKYYISLTPVISGSNINTMFPIYTIHNVVPYYNNSIVFVGYFIDNWVDDDFKKFIVSSNYNFTFLINGDKDYPRLKVFKNTNIIINASAKQLSEYIIKSKFILSRKPPNVHHDRFSGAFSLAMSFKKPVIIDKQTYNIYNIPGIVFTNSYCEIIDKLQLTDKDYDSLLKEIDIFNIQHIEKNKKIMDSILIPSIQIQPPS